MVSDTNLSSILLKSVFSFIPTVLTALWPLWVICLVLIIVKVTLLIYRSHKLSKAGMKEIDVMSGQEFESFLATLFQRIGYSVKQVGSFAGDYGADLIVTKDDQKSAVQAKRHKSVVGVGAVREALGSIKIYECNKALVVTNSYFTKQAIIFARVNGIELWDRNVLAEKILSRNIHSITDE